MPTADDIRDGLAVNLSTITGLRRVTRLAAQVQPPCVAIGMPVPVERDTYDGTWRWETQIDLYVSAASTTGADSQLASYLDTSGAKSIIAAIESDRTLNGDVDSLVCTGVVDTDRIEESGSELWRVTFGVEVYV